MVAGSRLICGRDVKGKSREHCFIRVYCYSGVSPQHLRYSLEDSLQCSSRKRFGRELNDCPGVPLARIRASGVRRRLPSRITDHVAKNLALEAVVLENGFRVIDTPKHRNMFRAISSDNCCRKRGELHLKTTHGRYSRCVVKMGCRLGVESTPQLCNVVADPE
jgi:hypothetical protein